MANYADMMWQEYIYSPPPPHEYVVEGKLCNESKSKSSFLRSLKSNKCFFKLCVLVVCVFPLSFKDKKPVGHHSLKKKKKEYKMKTRSPRVLWFRRAQDLVKENLLRKSKTNMDWMRILETDRSEFRWFWETRTASNRDL